MSHLSYKDSVSENAVNLINKAAAQHSTAQHTPADSHSSIGWHISLLALLTPVFLFMYLQYFSVSL